MFASF